MGVRDVLAMRLAAVVAIAVLLLAGCAGDGDSSGDGDGPTEQAALVVRTNTRGGGGGDFARIPQIYDRVSPSVVAVPVEGEQGVGAGSGVVWDNEGLIVTNNHVVAGARELAVALATGERVAADVRATDPLTDLAVIEVDRDGLRTPISPSAFPTSAS